MPPPPKKNNFFPHLPSFLPRRESRRKEEATDGDDRQEEGRTRGQGSCCPTSCWAATLLSLVGAGVVVTHVWYRSGMFQEYSGNYVGILHEAYIHKDQNRLVTTNDHMKKNIFFYTPICECWTSDPCCICREPMFCWGTIRLLLAHRIRTNRLQSHPRSRKAKWRKAIVVG